MTSRRAARSFDTSVSLLDHIYEQMQIDEACGVREKRGFTWWGHRLAQRIWVEAPRDFVGQLIAKLHIETDLWKNVEDTENVRGKLSVCNRHAILSAFVLDPKQGTVRLHASLYFTDENVNTVQGLAVHIAAIQGADANIKADGLASQLNATVNESHHPMNGWRSQPDDMLNVIEQVYARLGKEPSRFLEVDFERLAAMDPAPWVVATADADGLTAEFPFFGNEPAPVTALQGKTKSWTAFLEVETTARHPQLGNGILLRLILPIDADPMLLNSAEAQEWTGFNQLGAWFHDNRGVSFVTFIPNAVFRVGLLENFIGTRRDG